MTKKTLLLDLTVDVPREISRLRNARSLAAIEWTERSAPDAGVEAEARCAEHVCRWMLHEWPRASARLLVKRAPWNAGRAVADKLGAWDSHSGQKAEISHKVSEKIEMDGRTFYVGIGDVAPSGIREAWRVARRFEGALLISELSGEEILKAVVQLMTTENNSSLLEAISAFLKLQTGVMVWVFPAFDDEYVYAFVVGSTDVVCNLK